MIVAKVSGEVSVDGEPSQFFEIHLTEDDIDMTRDSLEELVGDGKAKISVSMELKDKDMGSGFGAFVTVSLTCGQTEETVEEAVEMARELASSYVSDAFLSAQGAYEKFYKGRR